MRVSRGNERWADFYDGFCRAAHLTSESLTRRRRAASISGSSALHFISTVDKVNLQKILNFSASRPCHYISFAKSVLASLKAERN